MEMNKSLHSRKPTCNKNYDYNLPGYYFVTICTRQRTNILGRITRGNFYYNKIGKITKISWDQTPKHFKNIELDYYQIMPDHIHGIIIINSPDVGNANFAFPTDRSKMLLSKIIQQFKRQVTIQSKRII